MKLRFGLAGNPNCGKTTMFNALTGANQYVGNWPGVTVEKKSGRLKGSGEDEIEIVDLPGIYSLSPYTLEEVVSADFILKEKPDVIIDIVDATNIERNLYLTTQIIETGVPVVVALNMTDLLHKNGISINNKNLFVIRDEAKNRTIKSTGFVCGNAYVHIIPDSLNEEAKRYLIGQNGKSITKEYTSPKDIIAFMEIFKKAGSEG